MYSDVEQTLFHAVIEPDMPGVEDSIAAACQKGANPDLVCVESSSSCGLVREGLTLLTYSIHEGNLEIVEVLLRSGADPDRVDKLGWTPWMASTVAADYRDEIQALLTEYGASQEGGQIGQLCRAIYSGNVAAAKALQPSEKDFRLLAGFRVDLLRHQLTCKQHDMFVYLVEAGMP
ncbi:MAG: ankyrin repeat domain-containing protein, partial [Oceanospirillum sp.]|nr:ankyrin repeat domain-containing protein [Oceanospirillum sp.]